MTILELLRHHTHEAHAAIETVPALRRLLEPDLSVGEYTGTLRRLHAFHAAMEAPLAQRLRGVSRAGALLDNDRLAALEADLEWFGQPPMAVPVLAVPDSLLAALGALYVMEGSNLGGRIIGRHLARSLGVASGEGGSFYCGLTAEAARQRWQMLNDALRVEVDEAGASPQAVTVAAVCTFQALESWMRAAAAPAAVH
jgi:heme oxygenase